MLLVEILGSIGKYLEENPLNNSPETFWEAIDKDYSPTMRERVEKAVEDFTLENTKFYAPRRYDRLPLEGTVRYFKTGAW
jgi:hypothetical protein